MDNLRRALNISINQYGLRDNITITISQELDKLIAKEQKKLWEKKKLLGF